MALTKESLDLEIEIKTIQETIQARNDAGDLLKQDVIEGRQAVEHITTNITKNLCENLFNEMAGNGVLKKLIYAYFAIQDPRRFYSRQGATYLYQFFAEELLQRVFINPDSDTRAIPDIHEARKKVDEMIAELI